MYVKTEREFFKKELFDAETGEVVTATGTREVQHKYYSVKKLNAKVCIMDLAEAMEKVCSSKQDIYIFWKIIDSLDKENTFRKVVSKWSIAIGVNERKVREIISRSVKVGVMRKVERGVYLYNPFMLSSKGSTNEIIEKLQDEWQQGNK